MPVQPLLTASSARYSCAVSPIAAALTRSGRSLLTSTTSAPSAARFAATARIRASPRAVAQRRRQGRLRDVVELDAQRPAGLPDRERRSSRPCSTRRSSSSRSACRANQPSSGWSRLPSSSPTTTRGRTTSCSSKRPTACGSDSRTEVSSTKVVMGGPRRVRSGPGPGPRGGRSGPPPAERTALLHVGLPGGATGAPPPLPTLGRPATRPTHGGRTGRHPPRRPAAEVRVGRRGRPARGRPAGRRRAARRRASRRQLGPGAVGHGVHRPARVGQEAQLGAARAASCRPQRCRCPVARPGPRVCSSRAASVLVRSSGRRPARRRRRARGRPPRGTGSDVGASGRPRRWPAAPSRRAPR